MKKLKYDIKSYLSALSMRKRKSLLVEGATDKTMIYRLLNSYVPNLGLSIVIDSADLISANGLGNRKIVEEIAIKEPNRIVGWVDREFREFCLKEFIDHSPKHIKCGSNIYWTRGHSIENYLFYVERFIAFLEMNHSEDISQAIIQLITIAFDDLLSWALALSIIFEKANLISKSKDIFDLNSWDVSFLNGSISLSVNKSEIQKKLTDRGCPESDVIFALNQIESIYAVCHSKTIFIRRWMAHGHIAEEAMWAGIGKMCLEKGVSQVASHNIAVGFTDMKRKHGADWWVRTMRPNPCDVYPSEFIDHIKKICDEVVESKDESEAIRMGNAHH
jgi:hypothetical protein